MATLIVKRLMEAMVSIALLFLLVDIFLFILPENNFFASVYGKQGILKLLFWCLPFGVIIAAVRHFVRKNKETKKSKYPRNFLIR